MSDATTPTPAARPLFTCAKCGAATIVVFERNHHPYCTTCAPCPCAHHQRERAAAQTTREGAIADAVLRALHEAARAKWGDTLGDDLNEVVIDVAAVVASLDGAPVAPVDDEELLR